MSGGRESKRGSAQFLRTTLQMIEDLHPGSAVRWAEDGRSFVIESPEQFLKILPQYFKTRNYSSFVRQLNMYDFHKVKNAQGFHEFRHEKFLRGRPELLDEIKRKVTDLGAEGDEMADLRMIALEKARVEEKLADLNDTVQAIRAQNISLKLSCREISKAFDAFRKSFDTKMSKVFIQFLSLMQAYNPSMFEENSVKTKELQQLEKASRSFPAEMLAGLPGPGDEETGLSEKGSFFNWNAEQPGAQLPQYLRQPFSPPLMILDKDPLSPNIHDHLKIDSLLNSPAPDFSKPEDDLYPDNYSLNSLQLGSFHKQPNALLLAPEPPNNG